MPVGAITEANNYAKEAFRMNEYMAHIALPADPPEEFISLIPRQRLHVNRLLNEGVLTSYSLAFDRSRLWVTICAPSEQEAVGIVARFPLFRWMEVEIEELMFRNTVVTAMPLVSLN